MTTKTRQRRPDVPGQTASAQRHVCHFLLSYKSPACLSPILIFVNLKRPRCEVNSVLSRTSISICQYPKSASRAKSTIASLKVAMHASMLRRYKARILTTCNFRSSTENRREPFFLEANTVEAGQSIVASSTALLLIIWPVSATENLLGVGHAWNGAKWTGLTSSLRTSSRCLASLIRSRCPPHILSNSSSISRNEGRWYLTLAANCTPSVRLFFRLSSTFSLTASCCAICSYR